MALFCPNVSTFVSLRLFGLVNILVDWTLVLFHLNKASSFSRTKKNVCRRASSRVVLFLDGSYVVSRWKSPNIH